MAYKDTQKELKQPDDFQKLGETAVPWLEKHGKQVVGGVLAVVGVGLVISIVNSVGKASEENAVKDLGLALRVLDRNVSETPPTTLAPGEEPPFKTEAEKDAAIIAKLTEFRTKNAGKPAAATAALPLAQAMIRQGKGAEAVTLVDEYLRNADPTDPMKAAAYEARGYALEAQQKYDDALTAFDALSKETTTEFLKGMGMYHRARILQLKGDLQGAAKQFTDVTTSSPDSAAARMSKERIALLAQQGIIIAKPVAMPAAVDAGT